MPSVSPQFQTLHDGVRKELGQEPEVLAPDEFGTVGFSLGTHGTELHAMQSEDGKSVLLMAELGLLPVGAEREGMEALLDANYILLEPGSPVFSRNPISKQVTLQCTRDAEGMSAADLVALAEQVIELATNWTSGQLLATLKEQVAQNRPVATNVFA